MLDGVAGRAISVASGTTGIDIFSMCLAMQGLFILYRASYDILKAYHPTIKFAAIKLVVLIATTQKFLIVVAVPLHAGYGIYDRVALINLGNAFLLTIESAIVGRVMYHAFPVSELRRHEHGDAHREYEEGFVEVDLDPTSPDEIREIGSRRGSSAPVTGPSSPQRQDSTQQFDVNGVPQNLPLDNQLIVQDEMSRSRVGSGSQGTLEMAALHTESGTPVSTTTRTFASFPRVPSEGAPQYTESSLFGKRNGLLERNVPLSDS